MDDLLGGLLGGQGGAGRTVAEVLQRVVDQLSPQGELTAETEFDDLFSRIAAAGNTPRRG